MDEVVPRKIKYRFAGAEIFFVMFVAIVADLLTLIPFVGDFLGWIFWLFFTMYCLFIKGIIVKPLQLVISGASALIELVPILQMLPSGWDYHYRNIQSDRLEGCGIPHTKSLYVR